MPLPEKGHAPYAPGKTVIGFINHVRDRGIPPTITEDYVGRIPEVGKAYARRTLRALEQLDLVDPKTHKATETLTRISDEPADQLQAVLAEWFTAAYAPVLRFISPTHRPDVIIGGFESYSPEGQRERMMQLFLSLAAAAGLISEVPKRPRGATAQPKAGRPTQPRPSRSVKSPEPAKHTTTPPDKVTTSVLPSGGSAKERYLDLLINLAEKANGKPDAELLDRIERVLGVPTTGGSP